ncbi:UNVERIFIED_CONTAM: hypothetical protein K2H54_008426, partial [Gekko kuhli]
VYVPDDLNATLGRTANKQVFEGLTTGILRIVAVVFRCLISSVPYGNNQTCTSKLLQETKNKTSPAEAFNGRIQDLISYVVNIGLIEKLSCCFQSVQGPIDDNPKIATFLQNATAALQGMCQLCFTVNGSPGARLAVKLRPELTTLGPAEKPKGKSFPFAYLTSSQLQKTEPK